MHRIRLTATALLFVALTAGMALPEQAGIVNALDVLWLVVAGVLFRQILTVTTQKGATMAATTLTPATLTLSEIEEALLQAEPGTAEHTALADELAARISGIEV